MATPNNRILVVDDEKDIVQAYVDFLAPKEISPARRSSRVPGGAAEPALLQTCEVLTATSGEAALAFFKAEYAAGRRIAGGFFDVKMDGGMDGLQTIREIWKIDRDMHCTVVTAYHDRSVDDIDRLFGPDFKDQWDYLNKPFTLAEITQKARQMMAAWNRMRSLESAHAQLVFSERMAAIGQVARGISHEFGNLLQAIMGKADLALQDQDPGKIKERLNHIIHAVDRASFIVRNLQSFSKSTATRSAVDLGKAIKDTLSLVNHELIKHSIRVVDQCTVCGPVQANAAELEQVILNLVINAIHAMPAGGTIEIGCKELPTTNPADSVPTVMAWVKDSGTGISPEVLPRIFEYAFTTKGDKGSGLGLSISREIVEKHEGKMSVRTEVGKGTAFILEFRRQQT
ncbi:MAG: hypothetical protein A2070_06650 [Bdellovibrionales bacterium GWC1_52_8]|nr:MAG: hypothetical protein A2Z97_15155 [Bdellovibrionales bacterium GWB1_52_6]OFZ03894.1 MAG: hypothetical protein A2X97_15965 [Bdellovibrionales bacterium GWA1_52_35]OFZ39473.1 MAG: hypothetical protein A2070_06650 [Bdellovibrionales bacterium GWC1_52_8]HCM39671.1 hypothetical protein [Bdellovibrionales bacterium]